MGFSCITFINTGCHLLASRLEMVSFLSLHYFNHKSSLRGAFNDSILIVLSSPPDEGCRVLTYSDTRYLQEFCWCSLRFHMKQQFLESPQYVCRSSSLWDRKEKSLITRSPQTPAMHFLQFWENVLSVMGGCCRCS